MAAGLSCCQVAYALIAALLSNLSVQSLLWAALPHGQTQSSESISLMFSLTHAALGAIPQRWTCMAEERNKKHLKRDSLQAQNQPPTCERWPHIALNHHLMISFFLFLLSLFLSRQYTDAPQHPWSSIPSKGAPTGCSATQTLSSCTISAGRQQASSSSGCDQKPSRSPPSARPRPLIPSLINLILILNPMLSPMTIRQKVIVWGADSCLTWIWTTCR